MDAYDKVNVRRVALELKRQIWNSFYDDELEEFYPWTQESYRAHLTQRLDYLVKRKAIVKYEIDKVFVDDDGIPYGDVFIIPATAVDRIDLNIKITKEIVEFTENSG